MACRRDEAEFGGLPEIALEVAHEGAHPRFMLLALIALFARGVDVVEVDHGDRDALRLAAVLGLTARRRQPQARRQYCKKEIMHVVKPVVSRPDCADLPAAGKRTHPGDGRANCPIFQTALQRGRLCL